RSLPGFKRHETGQDLGWGRAPGEVGGLGSATDLLLDGEADRLYRMGGRRWPCVPSCRQTAALANRAAFNWSRRLGTHLYMVELRLLQSLSGSCRLAVAVASGASQPNSCLTPFADIRQAHKFSTQGCRLREPCNGG